MNRPPERDFSEFAPTTSILDEAGARLALWRTIDRERSRRRRRRSGARLGVATVVLFVVWASAPPTADVSGRQLLRLAEAVADGGGDASGGSLGWYERSLVVDRIEVPGELAASLGVTDYRFDVERITETWVSADGSVRRRVTYGEPRFPVGADARLFDIAGLAEQYPVGRTVETLGTSEPSPLALPWEEGTAAVLGVIRRQVATSSDARPESAQVLDMVVRLIQEEHSHPSRRATLIRVLASMPELQVTSTDDGVTVSARYVLGQEAMEKRIVLERDTGDLVSHVVERLATPTSGSYFVEQHWYVEPEPAPSAAVPTS